MRGMHGNFISPVSATYLAMLEYFSFNPAYESQNFYYDDDLSPSTSTPTTLNIFLQGIIIIS
jgi:hypothetical protein